MKRASGIFALPFYFTHLQWYWESLHEVCPFHFQNKSLIFHYYPFRRFTLPNIRHISKSYCLSVKKLYYPFPVGSFYSWNALQVEGKLSSMIPVAFDNLRDWIFFVQLVIAFCLSAFTVATRPWQNDEWCEILQSQSWKITASFLAFFWMECVSIASSRSPNSGWGEVAPAQYHSKTKWAMFSDHYGRQLAECRRRLPCEGELSFHVATLWSTAHQNSFLFMTGCMEMLSEHIELHSPQHKSWLYGRDTSIKISRI